MHILNFFFRCMNVFHIFISILSLSSSLDEIFIKIYRVLFAEILMKYFYIVGLLQITQKRKRVVGWLLAFFAISDFPLAQKVQNENGQA